LFPPSKKLTTKAQIYSAVASFMRKQRSQIITMKILEGVMKIIERWIFWKFKGDYKWMNGMNFNGKDG
jgi:hypothetical protein